MIFYRCRRWLRMSLPFVFLSENFYVLFWTRLPFPFSSSFYYVCASGNNVNQRQWIIVYDLGTSHDEQYIVTLAQWQSVFKIQLCSKNMTLVTKSSMLPAHFVRQPHLRNSVPSTCSCNLYWEYFFFFFMFMFCFASPH